MVDPEAIRTVGLTVSAALGLGPGVRGALAKVFGPSLDAIGDSLKARTSAHLQRNLRTVAVRAAEMVEQTGKEPQPISPRLAQPLFDGASLEDDPELQERWAALIANAALADTSRRVRPAFAEALSRMQPIDAQILLFLCQFTGPDGAQPWTPIKPETVFEHFISRGDHVQGSIDLLASLGLASVHSKIPSTNLADEGGLRFVEHPGAPWQRMVQISDLGVEFLAACTPPTARD